jgi:hypothetical protein
MGIGRFFKKVSHGASKLFKKATHETSDLFKKGGAIQKGLDTASHGLATGGKILGALSNSPIGAALPITGMLAKGLNLGSKVLNVATHGANALTSTANDIKNKQDIGQTVSNALEKAAIMKDAIKGPQFA